tara:strand:+ start:78 stop:269 length:192 start_codon:yes stop_codon:yes gene_type:complete
MKEKLGIFYIAIIIGWAFITVIFGYGLSQTGIHEGFSYFLGMIIFWVGMYVLMKSERKDDEND